MTGKEILFAVGSTRSSTVGGGIFAQSSAEGGNEEDKPAVRKGFLTPFKIKNKFALQSQDLVCLDVIIFWVLTFNKVLTVSVSDVGLLLPAIDKTKWPNCAPCSHCANYS